METALSSEYGFSTEVEKRDDRSPNKQESLMESIEKYWLPFWRENPHRYVKDVLKITLYTFQDIIFNSFSEASAGVFIGTRGIGKSFIIMLYAFTMSVLYPRNETVIVCKQKLMAKNMVEKYLLIQLAGLTPMVNLEIDDIEYKEEGILVKFKNGSTILATNASEFRRGLRANILIVDEAVQVPKTILEKVLKPFTNNPIKRAYRERKEYRNYIDKENQIIYMTSAWYKNHYFYQDYYLPYIKDMANEDKSRGDHKVITLGYETSLREGLLTEQQIEEAKATNDPMTFMMEYMSVFFGENSDSFFKMNEIDNCRNLREVFYPPSELEFMRERVNRQKSYHLKRKKNEVRLVSCDIAVMGGNKNDNSIYSVMRMYNEKKSYHKELLHMESHNGETPERQALLIKRLFYDSQSDICIIDAHGIGYSVYSELKKETYDEVRGIMYPQWGAYNEVDCPYGIEADSISYVMYAMKASADTNHKMALGLKNSLMSGKISLPLNDNDIVEYLEKKYEWSTLDGEEQARLINPFLQTTLLLGELINLEYNIVNGKIQIKENASARKDRYSSVGYGNYLLDIFIEDNYSTSSGDEIIFFT